MTRSKRANEISESGVMKRLITAIVLILATVSAHAELFSFYGITSNDPSGDAVTIGEAQLSMDVTVLSPTSVQLLIANTGLDYNSVSKICFDGPDGINLGIISIIPSNWSEGNTQLPGGDGWFNSDFCIHADPPPSMNGITPLTSPLEVILSYTAGFDILDSLYTTDLRVGMHVVGMGDDGFGDDFSESFINNIPEPSTALLLGFIALVGKSYRRIFVV